MYGDYGSVADVIDTAQHIPSLGKSQTTISLDAASALSCSPTERSTEEETPIARAVSGPLCVCARSLLITGIVRDATITPLQRQKGRQISKGDTRNKGWKNSYRAIRVGVLTLQSAEHSLAPPTWKEPHDRFFVRGLCSFLFPDREIYRGRDA